MKANNYNWWWWFYGITKGPTEDNLLLVYHYNSDLPGNLLEVTLKYKIDGLIDKLHNTLNELTTNRSDLSVKSIKPIEITIETLKTIGDCANYKDKEVERNSFDKFCKLIIKIGKKDDLGKNLFKTNVRLNKEVLCEGCKRKEIRKLANKCGNEEIAKLLYECRLNAKHHDNYIQWIPFDKFKNIKYLAKGDFGEIHKATWIDRDREVVFKKNIQLK